MLFPKLSQFSERVARLVFVLAVFSHLDLQNFQIALHTFHGPVNTKIRHIK